MIIAGERRFRASKMAGKTTIPAYVREVNDDLMMEMALVENIQREDLNAIEIALSCQNLMEKCNYTQEQLSERIGKKRATVTNYLRLLRLPADIQMALKDRKLIWGMLVRWLV
jgi:ParB family chromosome partitioning protein